MTPAVRMWPACVVTLTTLCAACAAAPGPADVLSGRNDDGRTGANLREGILTPRAIRERGLHKLFTYNVDGFVYAQPLIASDVTTSFGSRTLLVVATTTNKLYAFDADSNTANNGLIWEKPLTVPGAALTETASDLTHLAPSVGILSTPVIDKQNGTIYVVSRSHVTGGGSDQYVQQLHARALDTGEPKQPPVTIDAVVNGVRFNPAIHTNRPGLALANGMVIIAWGPFLDEPRSQGWVMAYDAGTLEQRGVFCTTCTRGWGGTIWQSGRPPAIDAKGQFAYLFTSNGSWRGNPKVAESCKPALDQKPGDYFAESMLKLDLRRPDLWSSRQAVASWSPYDWCELEVHDTDLGGSGPMLLPGAARPSPPWGGAGPQSGPTMIAIGGGKAGLLYAIDTAKISSSNLIEWMALPAPNQHLKLSAINECIDFDTYEGTIDPPDGTGVNVPGQWPYPPVSIPLSPHFDEHGAPLPTIRRPLCTPVNIHPNDTLNYGVKSDGKTHHVMAGPVFWPNTWLIDAGLPIDQPGTGVLYVEPENLPLVAYDVREGHITGVRAHGHQEQAGCPRPGVSGHPGGQLALSANGTLPDSGVVWVSHYRREGPNDHAISTMRQGVLEAYDAATLALLWTSDRGDRVGPFAKFTPPTVANGKVYLAVSPSPNPGTCINPDKCPPYNPAGSNGGIAIYGLNSNPMTQCLVIPGPRQRPFDLFYRDPGPLAIVIASTIALTVAVMLAVAIILGRRRAGRN
jgi:outer membrane protein assembly factor BamB